MDIRLLTLYASTGSETWSWTACDSAQHDPVNYGQSTAQHHLQPEEQLQ